MLNNIMAKVQHFTKLEIIPVLWGKSDNRSHNFDICGRPLEDVVGLLARSAHVVYIFDASHKVKYHLEELRR
jgi:hypothetical protein